MKRVIYCIFIGFAVLTTFSFSSCKNSFTAKSYDDMLQVYNSKYFTLTPTDPIETKITDAGFSQESMLENRYTFIQGYETTLVAPAGGTTYSWKIQNSDGTMQDESLCEERVYTFIPEEDFKLNAETKLVLTVTNDAGTEYIDTTIIIVLNRE